MKKTIFFSFLLLFIALAVGARELKVESFEAEPTDITARTNAVNDLNGNKCALIKVSLPVAGCDFKGNVLKQEFQVNEYYVYMSGGTKDLQVRCPGVESLMVDFRPFTEGKGLESGMTYYLRLSGYEEPSTTKTTPTPETTINGHEAVDLGLSVKWATCNLGATKPSDYGNYYAWGETTTKSTYMENNSKTYRKFMNDIGSTKYDVAHTDWGGSWRIPTKDEFQELIDKCNWQWTTIEGHAGFKVTGQNGNSIFLPAAGCRIGDSANYVESLGIYWSSTPISDNYRAWELEFGGTGGRMSGTLRDYGQSVRPVLE